MSLSLPTLNLLAAYVAGLPLKPMPAKSLILLGSNHYNEGAILVHVGGDNAEPDYLFIRAIPFDGDVAAAMDTTCNRAWKAANIKPGEHVINTVPARYEEA